MNTWNQMPLVRLLLPFIAGILCATYLPFQFQYSLFVIILLAIIIFSVVLIPRLTISYRNSWWFGLLVNTTLFFSAFQLTIYKTENLSPLHFSKYIDSTQFVIAQLQEPCEEKNKSMKTIVKIIAVKRHENWENTIGKAMIYIQKDSISQQLKYGDEIIAKVNFKNIPSVQNPGEFNYKRFLAFHNIFQQAYIKSPDWKFTGNNNGNFIRRYSIFLRDKLLTIFSEHNIKGDEYAVGSALLLGYEDKLDADIIQAYASTGALHVLSVSGLHVAIVYVVFNWLLFFFDKIKHGKIIKAVILILMLWFYSALTGLSPSVLRAAAMFSFIIIAKAFNRYTNIYNTLAASAFLLLVINPYLIMEVGFQLSYIAVLGIVYIQPKIYQWFEINNWLLDQIWTITCVSIAAQIATFPLGLHYFHQFPNYFLLSNFVVIPVSTVIIYVGIALFAFVKISLLATYLAIGFNYSVWFLNASVKYLESLPNALIQGISISVFETWLIYASIILFFYYFTKRKYKYLVYALFVSVLILCSQLVEQHYQYQQKIMVVYNIPKTSAIDFISGKENVLLTDSLLARDESKLLFHIKHNWWDLGVNKNRIVSENYETNMLTIKNEKIQFHDKKIIVLKSKLELRKKNISLIKPVELDYLIISKNPYLKITDIKKIYHPKQIIFDSSNSLYHINKWKEECEELHQNYYCVSDNGAFVLKLE